ncbi:MAG: glycosyltransferase [Flavobacteriia bacterium]|nr:glycosyltransferase [Flavobacteriia bacterium]
MKKVLIITYHWPPMGGGGVQRWLKMSKYLRDYGWEPIIFTVSDNEISNYDESLLSEVPEGVETLRVPIWEPFGLYKKFTGKKKDEKVQPGFLEESSGNKTLVSLAYWIRGNIFIPDAKRFWIRPASKALTKYLKENKVDAIVSTGPPHSTHIIALNAKRKTKVPWLADFRDPWTFVDYYDKLKLSKAADRRHHKLERNVINSADEAVTVTWSWARDFNKMKFNKEVKVVTNGYDPADFVDNSGVLDSEFTITHIGSMNADRNPHSLWKALEALLKTNDELKKHLKIKLIGPVDHAVFVSLEKHNLTEYLEYIKGVPHKEVIGHLQSSQLLHLPLNDTPNIDGVVPGKLFEYIGAQRPILCIGKEEGDSARIINETQAGEVFGFGQWEPVRDYLERVFPEYLSKTLHVQSNQYTQYGRDVLAGQIVEHLDSISK